MEIKSVMSALDHVVNRAKAENTQAYIDTFSSPHGKKVLLNLFHVHGMLTSTFSSDPMEMARKEGERNVILRILKVMKTDPEEIKNLIRESDDALKELGR